MESEEEKGVGKNEKKTSGPIKPITKKRQNREIKKRVSRNSQKQRTNYLVLQRKGAAVKTPRK